MWVENVASMGIKMLGKKYKKDNIAPVRNNRHVLYLFTRYVIVFLDEIE